MVDCINNLDKCNADCCKYISITHGFMSEERKRYYELHNCKIVRITREKFLILVPLRCTALGEDNLCTLHNENKPAVCKQFDTGKTNNYWIPPNCLVK
jgi:hypothetical protein